MRRKFPGSNTNVKDINQLRKRSIAAGHLAKHLNVAKATAGGTTKRIVKYLTRMTP